LAHELFPVVRRFPFLGWAALRLKRGAYERMEGFIKKCEAKADEKWGKTKKAYRINIPKAAPDNQYSVYSFNCMTFGLCVLEAGANPNHRLKADLKDKAATGGFIDHPNADIKQWIARSHDGGYFYSCQLSKLPTISTGTQHDPDAGMLRRERPRMVR
jgi:hypothetical protein